jgi:hypothetical protein
MVNQALRLAEKDVEHVLPSFLVIDNNQVPALRIGASWRPAGSLSDLQQRVAADFSALCEPSNAFGVFLQPL